ncbi:hypothetical protein GCM10009799_33730 [Nocardiopsis rhodophaea]|uniref:Uncharacterized protein n=1 Tax=Nocardiopsis rhodophaea TaxID=280238 RepID=A0ABP5ES59_9ACTN
MLAEELRKALQEVSVSDDARSAVINEKELGADDTGQLRHIIARELYTRWHIGRPVEDEPPSRTLRDPDLEELLLAATPFEHTEIAVRALTEEDGNGQLLTEIEGVRVRVPAERVASRAWTGGEKPVTLRLDAVRAALSPGFFFTDRSRGRRDGKGGPTLRVYVHLLHSEAAPRVWRLILERLEDLGAPYRAKILSARGLFPRRDGIVVYLRPGAWHAVETVRDAVAESEENGIGHEGSVFTDQLAPGVATAWEPYDKRPGMKGLSFGEHRALAVAEGLIDHARHEESRFREREVSVSAALRRAGIDPLAPHRNLGSPTLDSKLSGGS